MKKIHYRNIGYPKSGTNWLWSQLMKHPQVDCKLTDDWKEFYGDSLTRYKSRYSNHDVSVNLHTHIFTCDCPDGHYAKPERIHEYTTHLSISFRNPYEVLNSMYNMDKNRNPNFKESPIRYTKLVDNGVVCVYSDTKQFFDNWKNCKLPIKYMFYDDLCSDPKQYMYDVCDHIGLDRFYDDTMGVKFKTKMNYPLVFEDEDTIRFVNEGISIIEDHTHRDLSSWKR